MSRKAAILASQGPADGNPPLVMDLAYDGNDTRKLTQELGYQAVVPPHPRRMGKKEREYDRVLYRSATR